MAPEQGIKLPSWHHLVGLHTLQSLRAVRSWWQAFVTHLDRISSGMHPVGLTNGYRRPATNLIDDIFGALYCSQSVASSAEAMNGAARRHILEPLVEGATR